MMPEHTFSPKKEAKNVPIVLSMFQAYRNKKYPLNAYIPTYLENVLDVLGYNIIRGIIFL